MSDAKENSATREVWCFVCYAHPCVCGHGASATPAKAVELDANYQPDGAIAAAFQWLRSALDCPAFAWDGDQRQYAERALLDAQKERARLLADRATERAIPVGVCAAPEA